MPTPQQENDELAYTAYTIHFEAWRSWSFNELLCHPPEAMQLCDLVRSKLRRPELEDHEILLAYLHATRRRGNCKPPPSSRQSPSHPPLRPTRPNGKARGRR